MLCNHPNIRLLLISFPFGKVEDAFRRTVWDQCALVAQRSRVSFVKTVVIAMAFVFFLRKFKAIEGTTKKHIAEVKRAL